MGSQEPPGLNSRIFGANAAENANARTVKCTRVCSWLGALQLVFAVGLAVRVFDACQQVVFRDRLVATELELCRLGKAFTTCPVSPFRQRGQKS